MFGILKIQGDQPTLFSAATSSVEKLSQIHWLLPRRVFLEMPMEDSKQCLIFCDYVAQTESLKVRLFQNYSHSLRDCLLRCSDMLGFEFSEENVAEMEKANCTPTAFVFL